MSAQYISFLETFCAMLLVSNILVLIIALLAWRWRPLPVDNASLSKLERRVLTLIEGVSR
jgi:hypothetical protein